MRSLMLIPAALVLLTPAKAAAPTLDQILARHLKANGTPEAVAALKTMRLTLKMSVAPGMEFPMSITTVYPNRMRTEVTAMGQTTITVVDGKNSWWVNPMMGKPDPEPLPAEMIEAMEGQARQFESPLMNHEAKGHKVTFVATETVDGASMHHLHLVPKKGPEQDLFLDVESYLLTQIKAHQAVQGQEMDVTVRMGDYKAVAGVMIPHTIDTKISGMPMAPKMVVEKAEPNVAVDPAIFVMPVKKAEAK